MSDYVELPRLTKRDEHGNVVQVTAVADVWRHYVSLHCDLCGFVAGGYDLPAVERKARSHRANHGPDHLCRSMTMEVEQRP
jgi:hypothetical protein